MLWEHGIWNDTPQGICEIDMIVLTFTIHTVHGGLIIHYLGMYFLPPRKVEVLTNLQLVLYLDVGPTSRSLY